MLVTALILAAGVLLAAATATASAPPRAAPIRRVLCVGDSLTASQYWLGLQLPGVSRDHIHGQGWGGQQPLYIAQHAQPLLVQYQPTDVVALFGVTEIATRVVQARQRGHVNAAAITAAIEHDLATAWALLRVRGARVWALTLTPWFGYVKYFGPHAPDAAAMRQITLAVNAWITAQEGRPGGPDHVIVTASLGDAQGRLLKRYSHGDLHMNGTGYQALAALVQKALRP